MQRDEKRVVTWSVIAALILISYFAVQKFWGQESSIQASLNASFAEREVSQTAPEKAVGDKAVLSYWEALAGQEEVDVFLHGTEQTADRVMSILGDSWPEEARVNIHHERDREPDFIEMWLQTAETGPLSENSWVLLQQDDWQAETLTTLERVVRQLLIEQPQLAITILSERNDGIKQDIDAFTRTYGVSWTTVDELGHVLPGISLARLPDEPVFGGAAAQEVKRVDSTDWFHGNVELRTISSEDHPFVFDEYYALFEPDHQVDFEVEGDEVGVVYLTDANGGIGAIDVNGETVGETDCYSEALSQRVEWVPLPGNGVQTLSINYTSEHSENASDSQVFVAGLIVLEEEE